VIFPNIARYIDVLEYSSMTRLSGYYGDPNFYSAHITAAIGGSILLILNETKIVRKIVIYFMIAVLMYCGFLSVSKSFALILLCMILLWIIEVLFKRGRLSGKVTMLMAVFVGGAYILTSILFTDLLDMMMERFVGAGNSLSEFTTKRSDLWLNYMRTFEDNPLVLLFGKGYTDDLVNGRGSHNVVIQLVYQFGLVGTVLTFVWFYEYCKIVLRTVRLKMEHIVQTLLVIGGTFGPWLGLDLLMFDEFFILPFFVFLGILYLNKEDGEESAESVMPDEVVE
jgi:O-antigen ligase